MMKTGATAMLAVSTLAGFAAAQSAATCAPLYARCVGPEPEDNATCCPGAVCLKKNEFYSQCRPAGGAVPLEWDGVVDVTRSPANTATTTPVAAVDETADEVSPVVMDAEDIVEMGLAPGMDAEDVEEMGLVPEINAEEMAEEDAMEEDTGDEDDEEAMEDASDDDEDADVEDEDDDEDTLVEDGNEDDEYTLVEDNDEDTLGEDDDEDTLGEDDDEDTLVEDEDEDTLVEDDDEDDEDTLVEDEDYDEDTLVEDEDYDEDEEFLVEDEIEDVAAVVPADSAVARDVATMYQAFSSMDYLPNPPSLVPLAVPVSDIKGAQATVASPQECEDLCSETEGCNAASYYLIPVSGANCWPKMMMNSCELPVDAILDSNAVLLLQFAADICADGTLAAEAPMAVADLTVAMDASDDAPMSDMLDDDAVGPVDPAVAPVTTTRALGDPSNVAITTPSPTDDNSASVSVRGAMITLAVAGAAAFF